MSPDLSLVRMLMSLIFNSEFTLYDMLQLVGEIVKIQAASASQSLLSHPPMMSPPSLDDKLKHVGHSCSDSFTVLFTKYPFCSILILKSTFLNAKELGMPRGRGFYSLPRGACTVPPEGLPHSILIVR